MSNKHLKIAIVGGGNIGKTLATLLVSAGYNVEIVSRQTKCTVKIDNKFLCEIAGDFGHKSYLVSYVDSIEKLSSKKDIII